MILLGGGNNNLQCVIPFQSRQTPSITLFSVNLGFATDCGSISSLHIIIEQNFRYVDINVSMCRPLLKVRTCIQTVYDQRKSSKRSVTP